MTKQFEKYLFSISISGSQIAKYSEGSNIILTHEIDGVEKASITFETVKSYVKCIDGIVSDKEAIKNKTKALASVLNSLFDTDF